MFRIRRSSVFMTPPSTLGGDLVFKHYTSKVVVATYPETRKVKTGRRQGELSIRLKEANAYALEVMKNSGLIAMYEKYLSEGETVYRKALMDYMRR